MLGKSSASPLLASNNHHVLRIGFASEALTTIPIVTIPNVSRNYRNAIAVRWTLSFTSKKWLLKSTAQVETTSFTEGGASWEMCRAALCTLSFSTDEANKILGKAFGQVHSPYWGEERKRVVPELEIINEILDYLRSLSLSDDDLSKVLKKFPEVLGCDLDTELKNNVQILEKQWGIKGKPLRNLLLRNPKALGYNVDCKGDCIAQCTRCWARF